MGKTRSTSTHRRGTRPHKAQEMGYVQMSAEHHEDCMARQRRVIRQWANRRDFGISRIHEER